MKVLVAGRAGREHALCWKLAQSPRVTEVHCAPGNPGMGAIPKCILTKAKRPEKIAEYAWYYGMDLVVIGPEALLTTDLVKRLKEHKISVFGPSREAAKIEWSKFNGKVFMDRWGIPTAPWCAVTRRPTTRRLIKAFGGLPIVLKADGLADGKGVFVPNTVAEFSKALQALFVDRVFGPASDVVIVEQKLYGREATVTCLSDGRRALMLPDAMDYKQALEGDKGLNTGGMGAHSPSFVLTDTQLEYVRERIMQPAINGLHSEGREFRGALTAGLMISPEGHISVLEFNTRFNDPECQVLMMRLDEDLAPLLYKAAAGTFTQEKIAIQNCVAANVVLTSAPYPSTPTKGEVIQGIAQANACTDVTIFHASTAYNAEGALVTNGGRVLNICAVADTLEGALNKAYKGASMAHWEHKAFRSDIGHRVVLPKSEAIGGKTQSS